MQEKLKRLMKHEGINSTRLAEILGIQPSGISHIMSGRNNPSFDFIKRLLQRFPQINPDWLISDKGPMYRDEIKKKNSPEPVTPKESNEVQSEPLDIFTASGQSATMRIDAPATAVSIPESADMIADKSLAAGFSGHVDTGEYGSASIAAKVGDFSKVESSGSNSVSRSSIDRIVVFYRDKTFSEYIPE